MASTGVDIDAVSVARTLVDAAGAAIDAAVAHAAEVTEGGALIDDYQVHTERIAYLATQVRAASALVASSEALREAGVHDEQQEDAALVYAAEATHTLRSAIEAARDDFGIDDAASALHERELRTAVRAGLDESRVRALGRRAIASLGVNNLDLRDDAAMLTRETAREFARNEVVPIAQEIHRQDLLVPDSLIERFSSLGFFGASIPEQYGGTGMGYLPMVVMTEELSAASLGAAGSLHTRPEILAHALLTGGTDAQKEEWLPKLASGEVLVAIGVTEPDVGSDNANLQVRATPATVDGVQGWRINGAKAWSTFSGRADVISMLVRTNPNPEAAGRGLSVLIVPKDPHYGHEWTQPQPEGGSMSATANPTPGYRGMHSFTVAIDNYFVPHANLVGEDEGMGRGFALQMGGFAVGRLQTGGRACGVAQASLEKACQYVTQREQFGKPIGEYQLTQFRIGEMVARLAAARQLTYAAAHDFDSRGLPAPMAKLLACDVAVDVSQAAQQLHGGWGYSEEDPIARYVSDALVLPIFEGVKPILELKVVGRQLLAAAAGR
ncbi:MAG: acyl-CoA dehydrogenase [Chloroflexi bacterium]|nr:acyl-CoA dehydrogenase [Chloroflexota bacterium]